MLVIWVHTDMRRGSIMKGRNVAEVDMLVRQSEVLFLQNKCQVMLLMNGAPEEGSLICGSAAVLSTI